MANLGKGVSMSQNSKLQYTLPIIQAPDFTEHSYFVSESNSLAYRLVESWGGGPDKMCVVYGPSGYGKTHLGHILKDRTGGILIKAKDIGVETIRYVERSGSYIVDDLEDIERKDLAFHFYNVAKEKECYVVYLLNQAPGVWNSGLADLNSRLRSLSAIPLKQPEDSMCRAIIKKIFADLQVSVKEDVIDYLQDHTSRNLAEIQKNIYKLNSASLEYRRNITIPFIRKVLNVGV